MSFRTAVICCSRSLSTSTCGCSTRSRLELRPPTFARGAATSATRPRAPWQQRGRQPREASKQGRDGWKGRGGDYGRSVETGRGRDGGERRHGFAAGRQWEQGKVFDGQRHAGHKDDGRSYEGRKREGTASEGRKYEGKPYEGRKHDAGKRVHNKYLLPDRPQSRSTAARSDPEATRSPRIDEFVSTTGSASNSIEGTEDIEGPTTTGASVRPVLRPYEVTQKVKDLAEKGKLDDAVSFVKSRPLSSQNTIVWNTLLMYMLKKGRYNAGYSLFIDMKRRGFTPIPSTWTILFQGFALRATKTAGGPLSEHYMDRVSSAYAQFTKVLEGLKDENPFAVEQYIIPFNAYLDLLLELGRHQELYNVFRSLDDYPSLHADAVTYAIIFRCLLKRPDEPWKGETVEVKEIRDAQLARKVWDDMRAREKEGIVVPVDSHLFSAILRLMTASPRIADQQYGLDLIEQYLGLIKPGTLSPTQGTKMPRSSDGQPLAMTGYSLHLALLLAARMRRFRYVLHYIQQVQDSAWASHILGAGHMNLAINAHGELAVAKGSTDVEEAFETIEWMIRQQQLDPSAWTKITPNQDTYTAMLRVCWKGRNYNYTRKTFSLMTGYDHHDFDKDEEPKPPSVARSRTYTRIVPGAIGSSPMFLPDTQGMSCLIHSSLSHVHDIHHALRILKHLGLDLFFLVKKRKGESRRDQRVAAFYRAKLGEAILTAKSIAGLNLPLDAKWLREASKRSREAKEEFERNWKVGPDLKEWMGESLTRDSVNALEEKVDADAKAQSESAKEAQPRLLAA